MNYITNYGGTVEYTFEPDIGEPTIDDVEIRPEDLVAGAAAAASHTDVRGAPKFGSLGLTDTKGRKMRLFAQVTDRYDTPEGKYVIAFIELLHLMVERRIKGDTGLLVNWLCLNIKHENQIYGFDQQQIVAETGIARPNISKALKVLEQDHEILLRGRGRSVIWLNPRYFFIGTAHRQRKAAEVWDQMMSVRPRTKETDRATVAALSDLVSQNSCEDMTESLHKIHAGTGPDYVTYGSQPPKRKRGRPRKVEVK
jgi:hypothetical protein